MPGNSAFVITNDHAQNEKIFEECENIFQKK